MSGRGSGNNVAIFHALGYIEGALNEVARKHNKALPYDAEPITREGMTALAQGLADIFDGFLTKVIEHQRDELNMTAPVSRGTDFSDDSLGDYCPEDPDRA